MTRLLIAYCAIALTWVLAPPAGAAPGLAGEPGLIFAPTADPVERGSYSLGVNTVDESYRRYDQSDPPPFHATVCQYLNLGVIPAVDITFRLTNIDGKLLTQYADPGERPAWVNPWGYPIGGYNVDRSLGGRLVILSQRGPWPALAVGARDVTGTSTFDARYVVATRRFPRPRRGQASGRGWAVHLGAGTDSLDGFFGGVDFQPTGRLGFVAERVRGEVHLGARWNVTRQLQIQPMLLDLRSFSAGMSYTGRL